MKQIKIFDTTLRDGEQSPGCSMNMKEKIEMAKQLERLNVDVIEAGFAASLSGRFFFGQDDSGDSEKLHCRQPEPRASGGYRQSL